MTETGVVDQAVVLFVAAAVVAGVLMAVIVCSMGFDSCMPPGSVDNGTKQRK